jgi:hypothetical protein
VPTGPAKGRQVISPTYYLGVLNSMMWSVLVREIPHLGIGEYRHLYRSLFEMTFTYLNRLLIHGTLFDYQVWSKLVRKQIGNGVFSSIQLISIVTKAAHSPAFGALYPVLGRMSLSPSFIVDKMVNPPPRTDSRGTVFPKNSDRVD